MAWAFVDNDPLRFLIKKYFQTLKNSKSILSKKFVFNFNRSTHVIVPSKAAKNTALKKFGVDEKITVNPYELNK